MNEEFGTDDAKKHGSPTNEKIHQSYDHGTQNSNHLETLLSESDTLPNTDNIVANKPESNDIKPDFFDSDPDYLCGIGNFRPKKLQYFTNIYSFIVFYAGPALVTSTLTSYITSQVTAIERQFGFSSANSGFLLACNDIGFLSTVLFVSYCFRNKHIPRVLAAGTFVYGISGLLCASPFFLDSSANTDQHLEDPLTDKGLNYTNDAFYMCIEKKDEEPSKEASPTNFWALSLIAIGMIIQGMGKSVRSPLIAVYVDNNVKRTKTGKFMGIITAIGIFGPAVSFSIATVFSRLHFSLRDVNITPEDPRWIGAWWLGFLSFGGVSIILCIPLIFFPKHLPRKHNDDGKTTEMVEMTETKKDKKLKPEFNKANVIKYIKDFFRSLRRICQKKSYLFLVCGVTSNIMGVGGVSSFGAKYIETQYHLPAWKSNAVLGVTNLLALSGGTLSGGLMTSKAKFSARGSLLFMTVCYAGVSIVGMLNLITGCDSVAMVGPSVIPNRATFENGTLIPHCKESCSCDDTKYLPICSESGINYYSPCYAGCHSKNESAYNDCRCIFNSTYATPTICETGCDNIIYYAIIVVLKFFFGTMKIVPYYISIIRIAGDKDKSLALGLSSFSISLIGWMAGPVFFGLIIDTTCLIWSSSDGSGRGSCVLYDTDKMRKAIFLTEGGLTCLASFFCMIALICHIRSQKQTMKEEIVNENLKVEIEAPQL
ncbi:solute carrier organic anion transporter family member 1C1 [Octopus bimaculoides]|uniref:Solute carrier organic anion transporter family member n=1 Tax=Octopus bimaculoides TaxID=37653 RepID=A0A0L8HR40_OCTBM|nr:solute carrier organic anion transporter family member 1C1 [Octopus bimaculoides]XP_014770123.1 solute carrier organic anion transporter family member 1C1 [Octopus bimaculoides]XP_052821615.1 solute carrier organic anion transporter family member 1C1 [Octopus bimaculoides]|eukprot:XP_014770122.1 PREDICTED: solute carrier organic anion transporter family member 1C1-like [Octopus bimaculoides]